MHRKDFMAKRLLPVLCVIIIATGGLKCLRNPKMNIPDKYTIWLKPYYNTDTLIFGSTYTRRDTIIFYFAASSYSSTSGLEQGYTKNYSLYVQYELSRNSFHNINIPDDGISPEDFIDINQSFDLLDTEKMPKPAIEISFLGLYFDDDYIQTVGHTSDTAILSADNAEYRDVNINYPIKSFEFSFSDGVLSFVDSSDHKWVRVKK